ncbi:catalase [Flavobacterium sp. ALD4]
MKSFSLLVYAGRYAPDLVLQGRLLCYLDAQRYRLGTNQ